MEDFQPVPEETDSANADQSADHPFSPSIAINRQEITPEHPKAVSQNDSDIQLESPSKNSSPKKIQSCNETIETETKDCYEEKNSSRNSNVDDTGL